MDYKVIKNIKNHNKIQNEISLPLWPEFMLHDTVALNKWSKLFELFSDYQFSLKFGDEFIGMANCIPLRWEQSFEELPEEGWDWAFKKGIADREEKRSPNILNGLQIAVDKKHQRKGVSSMILREMKKLAKTKGFKYIIIPVRPSLKSLYPLISIDDYIDWQRDDGMLYDPWLRVHEREGGEIVKVCHRAMNITGTVNQWENWTGLRFLQSGKYVVDGALNPVNIDIENNQGYYIEPNVWVLHKN